MNSEYTFLLDLQDGCKVEWKLLKSETDALPLCFALCPDSDRLVIGYDDNRIAVVDIHNKSLSEWSKMNKNRFPSNFLKRYNRYMGILALTSTKFLIYTNYTCINLDLSVNLPEGGDWQSIIENSQPEKTDEASAWFDLLKESQP